MMVLFVLLLTSCAAKESEPKETNSDTSVNSETQDTASDTTEVSEFYKTDMEVYDISTEYVTLKYPVRWKEYVSVSVNDDADGCSAVFTAELDGNSFDLYSFIIADNYEGYILGTINTDQGNKNVYLEDQYDSDILLVDEELQKKYYEMCEDVNVVISKLVYDCGMELV